MENIFLNLTFSITSITLAVSVFINILLAFVVYKNNSKSATHKLFVLLSLSIIFWLIEFYISIQIKPIIFSSLTWIRLSLFFATPMIFLFFLFSHTFPSEKLLIAKKSLFIILFLNFLVMATTISPYAFTDAKVVNNFPSPIPGPGFIIFLSFMSFLIFRTIYVLIKKHIDSSDDTEKKQLFFILWGFFLMHFFMFSTVLIPVAAFQKTTFVPLFPIYTLIFIVLTTYAILKHKLFNIKVLAVQVLTFAIWITLLVRIFISDNSTDKIIGTSIFLATVIFGVMLIKSVLNEIKMRERIETLYADLKVADEKLKKIDEEKSEFLFITSHQLRTPMTIIKGYISMMLEGDFGDLDTRLTAIINKIYISNERLVKIINDLLDLSRIERGKMDYSFKECGLEKIVSESISELKPNVKDKKLKLTFKKPEKELSKVLIDEDYTRQVIVNLIDNAIKYTDKGEIKIKLEEDSGIIRFSIKDEGAGISEETMPHLFKRYSREEKTYSKASRGMGLGLYIARRIVEDQRGKIWAESKGEGHGSTFFVELPVAG